MACSIGTLFLLAAGIRAQPWNIALIMVVCWLAWPRRKEDKAKGRTSLDIPAGWEDEEEDYK